MIAAAQRSFVTACDVIFCRSATWPPRRFASGDERCPVIGQIEVASLYWDNITSPETELTSYWCSSSRPLEEPMYEAKQHAGRNEMTPDATALKPPIWLLGSVPLGVRPQ